jgi:hypothetical protein
VSTTTTTSGAPALGVPPVSPSSIDDTANARRWSCFSNGSTGQVSGTTSPNNPSNAARTRPSSSTPVAGSTSKCNTHIPDSRLTYARHRAARR